MPDHSAYLYGAYIAFWLIPTVFIYSLWKKCRRLEDLIKKDDANLGLTKK